MNRRKKNFGRGMTVNVGNNYTTVQKTGTHTVMVAPSRRARNMGAGKKKKTRVQQSDYNNNNIDDEDEYDEAVGDNGNAPQDDAWY